jgi:hypothetical protein
VAADQLGTDLSFWATLNQLCCSRLAFSGIGNNFAGVVIYTAGFYTPRRPVPTAAN